METTWASLVSYGLIVEALTDFLPLEVTLAIQTVRHDALTVAQRCEDELGEEPRGVGERPYSWALLAGTGGIGIRTSGTLLEEETQAA